MKENESTDAHMHTRTHTHTPGIRAGKGMGGWEGWEGLTLVRIRAKYS